MITVAFLRDKWIVLTSPDYFRVARIVRQRLTRSVLQRVHILLTWDLQAIVRIEKALGTISPVLDQFDMQNQIPEKIGSNRAPSSEKD